METWWFLLFASISKAKLSNTFAFSFFKMCERCSFWIQDPQVWHPFLLLGIKKSVNSTTCWNQLHWLRSIHIVLLFTKMTWQKKVTCGKDITCSTKRVTYCGISHGIVMRMVLGGFGPMLFKYSISMWGWIFYIYIYILVQGILASKLFQT